MDEKEFFGEAEPGVNTKPSIISVVVDACLEEFQGHYLAREDGAFDLVDDQGNVVAVLVAGHVESDVKSWVQAMQGSDRVGDKIISLVQGNPGWQVIVSMRVIRQLRRRARSAAGTLG